MPRANYIIEVCIVSDDADRAEDNLAKNLEHIHKVEIYATSESEAITLAIEKCQEMLNDLPDEQGNTRFSYECTDTGDCPAPKIRIKKVTLEELKKIDRTQKKRTSSAILYKGKRAQGEVND